jgi:hypothetical protein
MEVNYKVGENKATKKLENIRAGAIVLKDSDNASGNITVEEGKTYTAYTDLCDGIRDILMSDSELRPYFEKYQELADTNNAFDTEIGRQPSVYEPYMTVQMHIIGTQVVPELETAETGVGES